MRGALEPKHIPSLDTVNSLAILYQGQGRHEDAEQLCDRALAEKEEVLEPKHMSTLDTVNDLGLLYEADTTVPSSRSARNCLLLAPEHRNRVWETIEVVRVACQANVVPINHAL